MKISVLVENKPAFASAFDPVVPNVSGEHGLALLVEHEGNRVLFDTGASSPLRPKIALAQVTELPVRNENFRFFWVVMVPLCRRKLFAVGKPTGLGCSTSIVVKTFSL